MKSVFTKLLSLAVVFSAVSSHAIEFKTKIDSDPLMITITENENSAYYLWGRSEFGTTRIVVTKPSRAYTIYNSLQQEVSGLITLSTQEGDQLMKFINRASLKCPLKLKIDRKTFQILEADLGCDPLAQVPTDSNMG